MGSEKAEWGSRTIEKLKDESERRKMDDERKRSEI